MFFPSLLSAIYILEEQGEWKEHIALNTRIFWEIPIIPLTVKAVLSFADQYFTSRIFVAEIPFSRAFR